MYLPDYLSIDAPIRGPGDDIGAVCFTFDAKWIPYILAALKGLTLPQAYSDQAARSSGEASQLLALFMGSGLCAAPEAGGIEMEECMGCCIRWSDSGVLQVFACGEWQDVPGPGGKGLANGAQPAQGVTQPPAGGCENFIGKVLFFGRWLLPIPVTAGDQVTVNNAFGATTDYILDYPGWKCADGTEFVAGGCVSGTAGFSSGDPAPAFHHGNLIGFDGTNYYDFGESANGTPVTITILPGISAANFAFLINSEGPAGAGDCSFDVRFCKQSAAPLAIAYAVGSGPGAFNSGDVLLMTFVNEGSDNGLDFSLSEECQVQVVGSTGWNFNSTASANRFIAGTNVQNYDLSATLPQDAAISGNADRMTWGCAPGGTTQVQIKVTKI